MILRAARPVSGCGEWNAIKSMTSHAAKLHIDPMSDCMQEFRPPSLHHHVAIHIQKNQTKTRLYSRAPGGQPAQDATGKRVRCNVDLPSLAGTQRNEKKNHTLHNWVRGKVYRPRGAVTASRLPPTMITAPRHQPGSVTANLRFNLKLHDATLYRVALWKHNRVHCSFLVGIPTWALVCDRLLGLEVLSLSQAGGSVSIVAAHYHGFHILHLHR